MKNTQISADSLAFTDSTLASAYRELNQAGSAIEHSEIALAIRFLLQNAVFAFLSDPYAMGFLKHGPTPSILRILKCTGYIHKNISFKPDLIQARQKNRMT